MFENISILYIINKDNNTDTNKYINALSAKIITEHTDLDNEALLSMADNLNISFNNTFDSLQLYKSNLLIKTVFNNSLLIDDNIVSKFNYNDDLLYFLIDLVAFIKNIDYDKEASPNIIYCNDKVLIYKYKDIYFLHNFNDLAMKIELPEELQYKDFYSVFCNSDKHLKDSFILGKHNFYVLERI